MKRIREIARLIIIYTKHMFFTLVYGMDISKSARISFGTKLDKTYAKGIHIDDESYLASGVVMLSHDFSRNIHTDTYIGKKCFIGVNVIILPGIKIGNEVIVGSGSIVTKDVPSNSIVAGNPAKIIKTDIHTKRFGQLLN
ncbi:Hexapeptide repeat of succinyl-transferase [Mariniphaga anaerophila]|uniref:Hexapeptide repeat of succinyl-transferase n=1 Tax=Mariniphaga anaerophila TaxID=1484053 RepID=A0A1M4VKA2_9BACT|nr:DapH/DapD/GlmU-related protein [Mariniphaga anaerophila]SHE69451.1 Hexapeptide repeat of succinyl-transferase [Mariniphaga anaerophila]